MSESGADRWHAHEVERWLAHRGAREVSAEPLAQGASSRRYWRVRGRGLPGGVETAAVMTMPRSLGSEELGRAAGRSTAEDFVAMADWLEARELPVPARHLVALEEGVIVLEDLGDRRLYDVVRDADPATVEAHYLRALDLLTAFERAAREGPADSPGHARTCGRETLRAELEHFLEWGLEARLDRPLEGAERRTLEPVFDDVAARLAEGPQLLQHRDFQSQNLMVTERGLVLIDFQDAFVAPALYDAVALLRDSYVRLGAEQLERLRAGHRGRRHELGLRGAGLETPVAYDELFDLQTIQRKLKDAGRFVYIDRVKGNPAYLRFFGDSVAYVRRALERFPDYAEAASLLERLVPELGEGRA